MQKDNLKKTLDSLYKKIHAERLSSDPLHVVRQFSDQADQEVAGFISALLAVGRADLIIRAVQNLFQRMDHNPTEFIRQFDPYQSEKHFKGFAYRFYNSNDIGLLVYWIKQMFEKAGSIQEFFMKGYRPTDEHVGPSLSHFVRRIGALDSAPFYKGELPKGSGARHWLTDPDAGSGCKRMNLFLRWMIRSKDIDLGLWKAIPPAKLIIPLDTYIARMGRRLGMTSRKNPDWKMAVEITDNLRRFDPGDPVKYDFVLCHTGMKYQCPVEDDFVDCVQCPLNRFCTSKDCS